VRRPRERRVLRERVTAGAATQPLPAGPRVPKAAGRRWNRLCSAYGRACTPKGSRSAPFATGAAWSPGLAAAPAATAAQSSASGRTPPLRPWPRGARGPTMERGWPSSRGGWRENRSSRKVRTPQGGVVGKPDPGKPAGQCHRNTPPTRRSCTWAPLAARLKWCGKSAPAARRRAGQANPTRCKAKQGR
jgi:hypothetical protein